MKEPHKELVEKVARALTRQGLLLCPEGATKEREIDEQWQRNKGHARAAIIALTTLSPAEDTVTEDLAALEDRLTNGVFFEDYDEDLRLLGVFRRHLATLRHAIPVHSTEGGSL